MEVDHVPSSKSQADNGQSGIPSELMHSVGAFTLPRPTCVAGCLHSSPNKTQAAQQ